MNAYQVYKNYLALRLHFTSDDYDVFQMQGRVRASRKAFAARKDLLSIERISKKYADSEIINFLVANFVTGDRWGGVFDIEAHDRYLDWTKRQESMGYVFRTELDNLSNHSQEWAELLATKKSSHPYIIKAFLGGHVSVETMTILDMLSEQSITSLAIADTIIWPNLRRIVVKYAPFLQFDHERYSEIFRSRFRFTVSENESSGGSGSTTSRTESSHAGTDNQSDVLNARYSALSHKASTKSTRHHQKSQHVALSDYFQ
jgi:hypothetical protein